MILTTISNNGPRSKVMVEEEGEVFRKGNVLLGPDEMEGEYDGEELRIEVHQVAFVKAFNGY